MADWQEWISSCFISLVFAYMLAKLISILVSFQRDKLRVEQEPADDPDSTLGTVTQAENPNVSQSLATTSEHSDISTWKHQNVLLKSEDNFPMTSQDVPVHSIDEKLRKGDDIDAVTHEHEAGKEKEEEESLLSDEEDWEGIHGSDLDKVFGKAASFLERLVLDPSCKLSNDTKLQFYGLYKQATEGPCSSPQPPVYRLSTRAKWNSWKSLGDISPEEGMQRYIALLLELYPDWNQATRDKEAMGSNVGPSKASSSTSSRMGPVFSTPLYDSTEQEGLEEVHKLAKKGDVRGLESLLQSTNTLVDLKDSDGRTALHWAADQGHLEVVRLLISCGADINAKDSEGQTPLHYSTTCEWDKISAFLLEKGADPSLVDNDGCTPYGQGGGPGE